MSPTVPAARVVFSDDDRRRILALVDEALQSGSLTLGPRTLEFEEAFARRHESDFAVATSSGTSALEIILRIAGVAGREVVIPANTFYATAAAVVHAGGLVRFADVDATTFAVSAASVGAVLSPQTTAVVVVHIGGLVSPALPAIRRLCDERGLILIEDAAHAHGSSLDGRMAGTFGHAAAFSFYPTKIITSAEGGMVVTGDERVATEARIYRDQGKGSFLDGGHVRMGAAWRMSELHAAVGRVHLDRLDEFLEVHRRTARHYDRQLRSVPGIVLPPVTETTSSNYYKYPILVDPAIARHQVKQRMLARGVSCSGEVYARPLHQEPIFAGWPDTTPVRPLTAEDVCAHHLCLPIHSDMTIAEADLVVEALGAAITDVAAHPGGS